MTPDLSIPEILAATRAAMEETLALFREAREIMEKELTQ